MSKFLDKIFSNGLDSTFLIAGNKSYSYRDLQNKIQDNIKKLDNVLEGSTIAILGDYELDSIAMIFACVKKNLIIAPLLRGDNELDSKLREAEIAYIYKNGILEKTLYKQANSLFNSLRDCGLILFSSGSTGKPKAIIHNFNSMLDSYLFKKPKKITLLLFLGFDHIGGINTLLNSLSINASGVALKNNKDIKEIAKAISKYHISLLPSSPSLLNLMLLSKVHLEHDLSSLRIITYGAERMPEALLARLKATFPKVKFHQTFGTSEVGIIQTSSKDSLIKLENVDYKIIDNELYIKSKTQSIGYLNANNNAFSPDGYFATGDLVEVIKENESEFIKIIGRKKEIINVGGEKLLPQELEGVVLELPFIKDCLAYGEANAILGQSVALKVSLNKEYEDMSNLELKRQIRLFCKDRLESYKLPSKVIKVDSITISTRAKKVR